MVEADLNETLFRKIVNNISNKAEYIGHEEIPFSNETGYNTRKISESKDRNNERVIGIRAYRVHYCTEADNAETDKTKNIVLKVKLQGRLQWHTLHDQLVSGDDPFGGLQRDFFDTTIDGEKKELACVSVNHPTWNTIQPKTWYTVNDKERDIYLVAMEHLHGDAVTHMDTVFDISDWTKQDIEDVFKGIAPLHALYYGNIDSIPDDVKKTLTYIKLAEIYDKTDTRSVFKCLIEYIEAHHGDLLEETGVSRILNRSIMNMGEIFAILFSSPTTLVHNDFNVRNLCLRKHPKPYQKRLCVYDWECVRLMPPQHDIVEFIAFVLPDGSSVELWEEYMDMYRQIFLNELESLGSPNELINNVRNKVEFKKVFHMCVLEFAWNRMGGYMYVSKLFPMPFLLRVTKNVYRYIAAFANEYDFLSA